jgi:hypothetical protein
MLKISPEAGLAPMKGHAIPGGIALELFAPSRCARAWLSYWRRHYYQRRQSDFLVRKYEEPKLRAKAISDRNTL